jgi:hypothetical protein
MTATHTGCNLFRPLLYLVNRPDAAKCRLLPDVTACRAVSGNQLIGTQSLSALGLNEL